MKKRCFPFIIVAFASILSCSRERDVVSETDVYSESALLLELSDYNQSVLSKRSNTRLPGWAKFCAVAGADFIAAGTGAKMGGEYGLAVGTVVGHPVEGAVIGGVVMGAICGVGASALAYDKVYGCAAVDPNALYNDLSCSVQDYYDDICEMIYDETKNDDDGPTQEGRNPLLFEGDKIAHVESLSLPATAIAMGAAHNVILRDLQNGVFYKTRADVSPIPNINNQPEIVQAISQDNAVRDYCVAYFQGIIEDDPLVDETLPGLVMQIYYELLQSSSIDESDVAEYINQYYSIVSASNELSDSEKESIYVGLAVSLFSFNYWGEYGISE